MYTFYIYITNGRRSKIFAWGLRAAQELQLKPEIVSPAMHSTPNEMIFDIFRCQPQIGWNLASETSRSFATKKVKDGNCMESSRVKLQLTRRTCWADLSLMDLNYLHSQLFVSRNAILMDHPIYYVCLARPGPSQTTSKLLWHWNQNWCNDFIMGSCKPSSLLRSILPLTDHLSSSQAWGSSDASACALPWWTASHDIGMLRHTSLAIILVLGNQAKAQW